MRLLRLTLILFYRIWFYVLVVLAILLLFPALLIGALSGGVFAMIFQQEAVIEFVGALEGIDQLVLNAGGMPDRYRENQAGCEYQCASQLLGHLLLFRCLHDTGKLAKGAKVIFVSSGGMLLKSLNMDTLFQSQNYDKVDQYANVKRAQVLMNEAYALRFPEYCFAAMHPGWVATRALQEALPGFSSRLASRLRSHHQGADTILWLLYCQQLESGLFWFDRKQANTNPLPWTRNTHADIKELETSVEAYINDSLVDLREET